MATGVNFSVNGVTTRCPNLDRSTFEPGGLEDAYMDNSLHYFGSSSWTYVWSRMNDDEVATLRTLYDSLVAQPVTAIPSLAVTNVAVPDFSDGGWKLVSCFMDEPSGTAVGDGTNDLTIQFYALGISNMYTAMNNPKGNHKTALESGMKLIFGVSDYPGTGNPF